MGAMKPQSAQANKVTVLAVPLVIAVVECAAMLWEHAIGAPADTMYTFAKDPLGLALLLAMTIASSAILLVRYWLPAVALALEAVLLIVASYWRLDSIVMIQTRLQYVAGNRPRKPNTKLPRNAGGQPSWPSNAMPQYAVRA